MDLNIKNVSGTRFGSTYFLLFDRITVVILTKS